MTYITDDLKEQFKDFLAEQDFIYDDNETGLTHSYYWDYRDIIEPWLMEKLIKDYGDYPTVKDALHQYNTTVTFMESLGIKHTDATEDFLDELLDLFYDLVTIDTNLERIIENTPDDILNMFDERED